MIFAEIMRQRDARSRVFGDLPEAAFLIVVGLWLVERRGKQTNAASACLDARAPQTTVLRHLARLEREGLVERAPGADRRMQWLALTDRARLKLGDFARQCGEASVWPPGDLRHLPPLDLSLFSFPAGAMRVVSVDVRVGHDGACARLISGG